MRSPRRADPVRSDGVLGIQYELTLNAGGRVVRGVISQVGAALRHLSVGDVALTPGFDDRRPAPFASGAILVPWPNRIRDGRWTHDGHTLQLDVTDPQHCAALHGLLRETPHQPTARSASAITLRARIDSPRGFPFDLDTVVRYQLTDVGLTTTHEIRNAGCRPAPIAIGAHPFLCISEVPTETMTLVIDGRKHVDVDDRLIPVGITAVDGTAWDLRGGRAVANLDVDHSWTDLTVMDGRSTHTLRAPDGRTVSLWAEEHFDFVHVFTTREYPRCGSPVTAIALEPMTAPADSLNNGIGLRWLPPGAGFSVSWGIRYDDGVGTQFP